MWVLLISAEDGVHSHVYPDEASALKGLEKQLGRPPVNGDRTYVDNWGRRLTIEERPAGWTASKERRLGNAYDRRECGLSLSKADRELLAEFEGL
jgi:hypothetical protein